MLSRITAFLRPYKRYIILWLIIIAMVLLGVVLGVDKKVIGVVVALFGIITQAFIGLLALVGVVPILGPLIVKIISLPLFWLLNGIGYVLSVFAIKQGYTKEVLNYRVLTVVFLIGVVIGFIIGQII
ncbi:MAG: hypothetical protein NTW14_05895 [bacterium]|nr:hypothetical protein [bacterium]